MRRMHMLRALTRGRFPGLLALWAGGLGLWQAWELYPVRVGLWIGDHVFPGLAGAGLTVGGLVVLLRGASGERELAGPSGAMKPEADGEADSEEDPKLQRRVAAVPVLLFGYTLLMPLSGYGMATAITALLLFRVIGGYAWWRCLLSAILVMVCLELVFVLWLETPLPRGPVSFF